ncbi:Nucleotidyltransferase lcsQ [Cladobotryum mycophilum]|uniref:Nucleotidyltransferase lcsQ n=1 Tax=Cladobotryum mycophilum TaxID=491253 RepID=A0ABR0T2B0_9HYPO
MIAREGFRAPNKLTAVMAACHRHHAEILELKVAVSNKAPYLQERDKFGMAIRKWEAQGGMWKLQVLVVMLMEATKCLETWSPPGNQERDRFVQGWQAFLDHLEKLDVYDAPNLKRLLDGRLLAKALGIRPGIWTGKALDICMSWQLRHPGEEDTAGAIEEVKRKRDELGITLPTAK